MLPAWKVIDYPVIKLVWDCYVCKLTGKTMVPDSIKGLWEIKGDDMDIVVRLEKLGQNLKKVEWLPQWSTQLDERRTDRDKGDSGQGEQE